MGSNTKDFVPPQNKKGDRVIATGFFKERARAIGIKKRGKVTYIPDNRKGSSRLFSRDRVDIIPDRINHRRYSILEVGGDRPKSHD